MDKPIRWGAALAMAALCVGCSAGDKAEVREEVKGVREQIRGAAADAQKAAENAGLAGKVKAALATRKGLDSRGIKVDAKDGAIVLKGDVSSREQAELAEKVASETKDVLSVDNQLMLRIPAKSVPPVTSPVPDTALPGK